MQESLLRLHWITFFGAINESNVSITLAMFSTGAFFASLIEPIIYKRRIIWYEIIIRNYCNNWCSYYNSK